MSGEIVKEWHFWLVSIATGAFMAFVYDVLRLLRRLLRHGRFAVDLEDILYWTACFGLSFTLLYYRNNGVIRFAAVLGAAGAVAAETSTSQTTAPPASHSQSPSRDGAAKPGERGS